MHSANPLNLRISKSGSEATATLDEVRHGAFTLDPPSATPPLTLPPSVPHIYTHTHTHTQPQPHSHTQLKHGLEESHINDNSSKYKMFSALHEGLAGAFAGSVQVMLLMWLRTTMSYQHKYGLSLKHSLRDLYKQGGIRRFYKGVEFAIIQAPLAKFFSGMILLQL
jgi:hypothetical protein